MVQSQGLKSFTIGQLAAGGGVGVETIRFYQRKGLLEQPTRESGIRRYGTNDLRRLLFIRQAQGAGFTLEEIRELLELDSGHDRKRARQLARSRIQALDQKIADLASARDSLERLATACGEGDKGPCPILASFDARSSKGGGAG